MPDCDAGNFGRGCGEVIGGAEDVVVAAVAAGDDVQSQMILSGKRNKD